MKGPKRLKKVYDTTRSVGPGRYQGPLRDTRPLIPLGLKDQKGTKDNSGPLRDTRLTMP